ncbi:hypothetical protein BTH42_00495 [Burkholderia sp. SRS-W-2-2016]|uniref:hypothetical protein n=1 Tax=Burkholderia sp. SRS-W-2-2016 TaxID=1926878 RepID=UPI00094AF26C|nr:hypothetical protein [Burkholderia sp. SRS-W-2-2016]OLL33689.1 hypothetical protein BTH42_00495 [Burkholderia sp. SRS-W-2-2016]
MTKNTARTAFAWLPAEARAALVAEVERTFDEAKATIAAFINQADCDDGDETDRDFMNRYGYPRSWDDEVPQPRQRPTPAGAIEAMLRSTACSSDELLFEGLTDD